VAEVQIIVIERKGISTKSTQSVRFLSLNDGIGRPMFLALDQIAFVDEITEGRSARVTMSSGNAFEFRVNRQIGCWQP